MFDIFKDNTNGFVARQKLVSAIEKKTGIGPISSRDMYLKALYQVIRNHNLENEVVEEMAKLY